MIKGVEKIWTEVNITLIKRIALLKTLFLIVLLMIILCLKVVIINKTTQNSIENISAFNDNKETSFTNKNWHNDYNNNNVIPKEEVINFPSFFKNIFTLMKKLLLTIKKVVILMIKKMKKIKQLWKMT